MKQVKDVCVCVWISRARRQTGGGIFKEKKSPTVTVLCNHNQNGRFAYLSVTLSIRHVSPLSI